MPAEIIRNAAIWLREFDLQSSFNAFAITREDPPIECTAFGAGSRTYALGLPRVAFSGGGYPIDEAADLALFTMAGLTGLTLTASVTRTAGAVAFVSKILDGQYSSTFSVDQVRTFNFTGETSERSFARGRIMHLGTAVAATSTGVITLLRAISAGKKAFASLHVTGITGTANFTGRIESDDLIGFTTPITRATFAPLTLPLLGSQLVSIDGPIPETFWRFAWTITGTGTVTFAAALGFEEPV